MQLLNAEAAADASTEGVVIKSDDVEVVTAVAVANEFVAGVEFNTFVEDNSVVDVVVVAVAVAVAVNIFGVITVALGIIFAFVSSVLL